MSMRHHVAVDGRYITVDGHPDTSQFGERVVITDGGHQITLTADGARQLASQMVEAADWAAAEPPAEQPKVCPDCGSDDPADRRTELSAIGAWRPAVVHTVGVRFLPGYHNQGAP